MASERMSAAAEAVHGKYYEPRAFAPASGPWHQLGISWPLAVASSLRPVDANASAARAGPATGLYPTCGTARDYFYFISAENDGIAYTLELRDDGRFGFLLPDDQITPNAEEMVRPRRIFANTCSF